MRPAILALTLSLAGAAAWADPTPIAYVKTVSGTASVSTGADTRSAEVGTPVYLGSVLRTGARSSLGVTFKDETVMSFGADTELVVDDYLYAPAQGKLRLASRLLRGSLDYISGVIAKLRPDAVSVDTPSGTIGVRGTQFVAKVDRGEQP